MSGDDMQDIIITKPGLTLLGKSCLSPSDLAFQGDAVSQMSCGWDHLAIVCKSGRAFTAGENKFNQLGLEGGDESVTRPTHVVTLGPSPVIQAACGLGFTYFLSDAGEVFACGSNKFGQLGMGKEAGCPLPSRVQGVPSVGKLSVGDCHAILIPEDGEVWVTGYNKDDRLGLGRKEHQTSFAPLPNIPGPVADVSCGDDHTAFLAASGSVYMTGWNKFGQLGCGRGPELQVLSPAPLRSKVSRVACGYEHTVALAVDGTVWAWGSNKHGQLGNGSRETGFTPRKVVGLEGLRVAGIYAGGHHTAVVTEDGDVFACGRGEDGELGLGHEDVDVPTLVPKSPHVVVTQVALASTYALILSVAKT